MGAFLEKPKTDKHNETGTGNGLRFALSSMQGWRIEMEDAHHAVIGLPGSLGDWSFFAVFDGHAGARVSAYCADKLLDAIISSDELLGGSNSNEPAWDSVSTAIRSGFLRLDDQLRELPEIAAGEDKSGSTAVCALVSPQHIFLANCGDSRAVVSRNKQVAVTTLDHKPTNAAEKERIQNAGGSVMIQRVNGSLAVSRALGDFEYKNVPNRDPCEQLVSPEPEIITEERVKGSDEFLILACDGIWDVMTNDELCDFVRDRMQVTDNLETICNCVVDTCLSKVCSFCLLSFLCRSYILDHLLQCYTLTLSSYLSLQSLWFSYLLENNFICNKQYGFIRGRSTMLHLLYMLDDWADCLEREDRLMLYIVSMRKFIIYYPTKD